MANAQWKNFQSPKQEGSSYQRSSSFSKSANNSQSSSNSSGALREAGIIEKLLHSYGFIQCCEKQARLFFHYSQFCGNIDFLKVGDAVEFETTYDRKTGKPIARDVVKISPESFSGDSMGEERVSGVVTTEIKNGNEGRIAYENRGECFFLPYSAEDVDPNLSHLQPGDKVTFLIVTDKQNGNPLAQNVRLEKPQPERHQGVICTLKETFGFIERADVVKEIFFHTSECKEFKNLNLGDDVDFFIQTRNNKEVATNVCCLPLGTVVFEDISPETIMGQVVKVIDRYQSRQATDPLPGRIRYRRENKPMEILFGDKDCKGDYTLQEGDWVQFNLAVDKRDKLQRATHIELMLDESFAVSSEKREQGIVAAVKDSYGFIKYGNRDSRLFFRYSEVVDMEQQIRVQDELEFTVVEDPASPNRNQAVRIRVLPPGTVALEHEGEFGSRHNRTVGVVEKEARSAKRSDKLSSASSQNNSNKNNGSGDDSLEGHIAFQLNGESKTLGYNLKDCVDGRSFPKLGDKVEFLICALDGGNEVASEVRVVHHNARNGYGYTHQGYVAALKESFGFIENEEHDREIFFHFSVFDGNPSQLDLGQEVEYGISTKGTKLSAECVRKISSGTIPSEEPLPEVLSGVVMRTVRCFNPDQEEYSGLIRVSNTGSSMNSSEEDQNSGSSEEESQTAPSSPRDAQTLHFGITSLVDKHDLLQKGDVVQFQVAPASGKNTKDRAVNIKALRTKFQAVVEAIRGSFGFLSHEVEEGKKLFFHMSEVKNGESLQAGDRVEFNIMHNQRNGKHSACGVLKIGEGTPSQRPERLVSRLRTISMDDSVPKIVVIRQPKGPDGSGGFKNLRTASFSVIPESDGPLSSASEDEEHLLAEDKVVPDNTNPLAEVVANGEAYQPLS